MDKSYLYPTDIAEIYGLLDRLYAVIDSVESHQESPRSVSAWANGTFGHAPSNLILAERANQEMVELLSLLSQDDNHPAAPVEIADVVICLYRLADRMGSDLMKEVDEKMRRNRTRKWSSANGVGQHVKAAP